MLLYTPGKSDLRHASSLPTSTSPKPARQPCAHAVSSFTRIAQQFKNLIMLVMFIAYSNNSDNSKQRQWYNRIPPCLSSPRLFALTVKTRRPSTARIVSKPDTPNEKMPCHMGYNTKRHDRVEVTLNSSVPSPKHEMAEGRTIQTRVLSSRTCANKQPNNPAPNQTIEIPVTVLPVP